MAVAGRGERERERGCVQGDPINTKHGHGDNYK